VLIAPLAIDFIAPARPEKKVERLRARRLKTEQTEQSELCVRFSDLVQSQALTVFVLIVITKQHMALAALVGRCVQISQHVAGD
jgi:hypothetical protein